MDPEAARYTSSSAFDKDIFEATVYVNAAHIRALQKIGVIGSGEAAEAVAVLKSLLEKRPDIPETVEDVHIYLETLVSKTVPKVGEMLALGKSRNDAVVAAVKIEAKRRLFDTSRKILEAVEELIQRSIEEAETVFPVYTHLQRAAPATFGFILQSYAIRLERCVSQLINSLEVLDESPLGSAAVAGTSIPLDRKFIAEILGFKKVSLNALEATASRDFLLQTVSALLNSAVVMSCFAEEMVLYCSEEFGLLRMAEELSATSSIMPQKRNPVVAEIMRTKSAELLAIVSSLAMMLSRQPSGYNIDLQQTTPKLWKAFRETGSTASLLKKMVMSVEVVRDKAYEACGPPTAAVEVANYLTMNRGVSFRKAHQIAAKISKAMASRSLSGNTLNTIFAEHGVQPCSLEELLSLMEPSRVVRAYAVDGSAHPDKVRETSRKILEEVAMLRSLVDMKSRELDHVLRLLMG